MLAGGFDQAHGVEHHARDVRLAVEGAAMAEQLRLRHHSIQRDCDKGRWADHQLAEREKRRLRLRLKRLNSVMMAAQQLGDVRR